MQSCRWHARTSPERAQAQADLGEVGRGRTSCGTAWAGHAAHAGSGLTDGEGQLRRVPWQGQRCRAQGSIPAGLPPPAAQLCASGLPQAAPLPRCAQTPLTSMGRAPSCSIKPVSDASRYAVHETNLHVLIFHSELRCRQNLVEADASDRKLEKLVDDNATAFAALGLGTLPGRDSGKQVQPVSDFTSAAACAMTSCITLMPAWPRYPGDHPHAGISCGCRAASVHCCQMVSRSQTAALTPIQGWFGGESDAVAATAGVRSDLAAVEAAAEERRKLHDAFKRQWNEDDIIQVGC